MAATQEHGAVASCLVVLAAASVAGVAGSTGVAIAVAIAVAVTSAVSIFRDEFAGAVVGLAASAALILGRRTVGPWGDDEFWLALAQTLGLIGTGTAAGRTGRVLRHRTSAEAAPNRLPEPTFGSLGLLHADIARARLEEEVERARGHQRPLCLVLVDVRTGEGLAADTVRSARRAIARIFESQLRPTDVPFTMTQERLGAILPETPTAQAWERIGAILDTVAEGGFTMRGGEVDGVLADVVRLEVGMAELGAGVSTSDALLDAATAALPRRNDVTGWST